MHPQRKKIWRKIPMNTLGVQTLHKIISTFTQEKCIHRLSIACEDKICILHIHWVNATHKYR